jgi:uncharacterized protein (DUF58 family)
MLTDEQIEEMMARVRKLELKARRLVRESFSGEYHSSFKGQGLDFDDFREYQHGDEVRFIDWNVTARMNQPFIRKFREEREVAMVLAVDVSGSSNYGSIGLSKRELTAEAAAILGFSALQNGDKVGLLLFAQEAVLFIPPAKGTRHLLRLIREILVARPSNPGTSIANACDFLIKTLRRKSLVFMISDFQSEPLEKPLAKLAKKHETLALQVSDPLEMMLPKAGRVVMIDPETGGGIQINTNSARVRDAYTAAMLRRRETLNAIFKKNGIDTVDLETDRDSLPALHKLLKRHSRKRTV